jgi:hypothetical protein
VPEPQRGEHEPAAGTIANPVRRHGAAVGVSRFGIPPFGEEQITELDLDIGFRELLRIGSEERSAKDECSGEQEASHLRRRAFSLLLLVLAGPHPRSRRLDSLRSLAAAAGAAD